MKQTLLLLAVIFSLSATAQNFYSSLETVPFKIRINSVDTTKKWKRTGSGGSDTIGKIDNQSFNLINRNTWSTDLLCREPIFNQYIFNSPEEKMVKDTIQVLMLIGDTAHIIKTYYKSIPCKDESKIAICFETINEDKGRNTGGNVHWVYGYEVRNKLCCVNGYTGMYSVYQPVPYYEHLFYLDDKKKRLLPSIIVWFGKEIKK